MENHFPNRTLLTCGSLFVLKPTTIPEITGFKTDIYKSRKQYFFQMTEYDICTAGSTLRKITPCVTGARGFKRPSFNLPKDLLERN